MSRGEELIHPGVLLLTEIVRTSEADFRRIPIFGSRVTGSDFVSGTRLDALGIPIWTDVYSAGWRMPLHSVEMFLSAHVEFV